MCDARRDHVCTGSDLPQAYAWRSSVERFRVGATPQRIASRASKTACPCIRSSPFGIGAERLARQRFAIDESSRATQRERISAASACELPKIFQRHGFAVVLQNARVCNEGVATSGA